MFIDGKETRRELVLTLKKAVIFIIALTTITTLYLFRYKHLLHNLYFYDDFNNPLSHKEITFPKLTMDQVVMLGGGHKKQNRTKSSYVTFPKDKKSGTIRIGIFGCSFVHGLETAKGYDFPTLLQDNFNKHGIENIEVINFALCGRGVHSMYLLWEFLGKDYNLDYVVFMPFKWHRHRDNSFIHPNTTYGPVHARYIIKDDKLQLIPVVGTTLSEAARIYNRLFPPWCYIRYDNKMPMFLQALLPSSLSKRSNPFYYKPVRFNKDEIFITYAMLFNKLSEHVYNLIIIANDNKIYSLRDHVRSQNVYFLRSQARSCFTNSLYWAPKGHNSALANKLYADELFSLLMGYSKSKLSVIKLFTNGEKLKSNFTPSSLPLYKYTDIYMAIGKHPVASFVMELSKPYYEGKGHPLYFQKAKIASLLLMKTTDKKFATFAALPFLLKDKEPVFLTFKADNDLITVPIGVINTPDGVVGKLLVDLNEENCFIKSGDNWVLKIEDSNIYLQANARIKEIYIMVGDKKILEKVMSFNSTIVSFLRNLILGKTSSNIINLEKQTVGSAIVYLRAKRGQFVDVDTLKEKEGTLDLVLIDENGYEQRYPIFSYEISPARTSVFDPIYQNSIFRNK